MVLTFFRRFWSFDCSLNTIEVYKSLKFYQPSLLTKLYIAENFAKLKNYVKFKLDSTHWRPIF